MTANWTERPWAIDLRRRLVALGGLVVSSKQTKVIDERFVRVLAWYDNEWGFSSRMSDVAVVMGALG